MADLNISEDMLQFFVACAYSQRVNIEDTPRRRGIYDNRISLELIPSEARAYFPTMPNYEDTFLQWFTKYLRIKFKFLSLLLNGINDDRDLEKTLEIDLYEKEWKEIVDIWRSEAEKERFAYLLRIAQLPLEIVHLAWYNPLPEFIEWSQLCKSSLDDRWITLKSSFSKEFKEKYITIWSSVAQKIDFSFENNYLLEMIHQILVLGMSVNTSPIYSHLTDLDSPKDVINTLEQYFNPNIEKEISHLYVSPTKRFVEQILSRFLEMLEAGISDETQYLREFAKLIANQFSCRVADYLTVEQNNEVIRIKATSYDITENALRNRLGETETYDKGEGITGSILLNPVPGTGFYVGTNNLAKDPRQSPWHETAYKKIYGATHDFWVFPLFDLKGLIGIFRVINRLDDNGQLVESGWPYLVRLQLLETARWFEQFWRIMQYMLKVLAIPHPSTTSEYYLVAQKLIKQLDLSWILPEVLENTIKHLLRIVHRKVEDRRVGCCIGIVEKNDLKTLERILGNYITIDSFQLMDLEFEEISKSYVRVHPTAGMFTFDERGKFQAVLQLHRGELKGEECMKYITQDYKKSLILVVGRVQKSLLIYHDSSLAAEYYLSDRSGGWKLRFYKEVLDRLLDKAEGVIPDRVINQVYDYAWQLSYNEVGALLIVVDALPGSVTSSKGVDLDVPLDRLSKVEFEDLASIDGAIIISRNGIITKAGAILQVVRNFQELPQDVENRITADGKSSRHRAAAQVSNAVPEALVIVVSKNRGISVFYKSKIIAWDM